MQKKGKIEREDDEHLRILAAASFACSPRSFVLRRVMPVLCAHDAADSCGGVEACAFRVCVCMCRVVCCET